MFLGIAELAGLGLDQRREAVFDIRSTRPGMAIVGITTTHTTLKHLVIPSFGVHENEPKLFSKARAYNPAKCGK
jgi:hypothetical protein